MNVGVKIYDFSNLLKRAHPFCGNNYEEGKLISSVKDNVMGVDPL